MRNDARPIGEEAGRQSPVPGRQASRQRDARDRVTEDRPSNIINRGAEENVGRKDTDTDPALPVREPTLNIRI